MLSQLYTSIVRSASDRAQLLAILVDPDNFDNSGAEQFLASLPRQTNYLFVGGSTVVEGATEATVKAFKRYTQLPILVFPGDHGQVTPEADALLFLSLLSGRNPEYLISQQVKAAGMLRTTELETIATGYLLIDGGNESAVQRVTETQPMSQDDVDLIVNTALAGQYLGMHLIYLEAGSGALHPVAPYIIRAVRKELKIPLLVGGGIRTEAQKEAAYKAGADLVVMGTAFEKSPNE